MYLSLVLANNSSGNVTILNGSSSNYTTKHVVGNTPIVIQTQIQHYDQPTLKEYEECHENLEKCKKVCQGVNDPVSCVKECPICPFLVKEKVVVQGINDTYINPATTTPLNTTNIIRLTNQIKNIIDNHQGNINYNNENVVHVHQNISRVGGKFGLGYNNTDPCCIVVRSTPNCLRRRFSTANRCHHKRHRVCGQQCKSRVMMAKRVTVCDNPGPLVGMEDYGEEICKETVKYFPYYSHKNDIFKSRNRCVSIPSWPYVSCGRNYQHSICNSCQQLTYYYILARGIPPQCRHCFMPHSPPTFDMYPSPWYPGIGSYPVDNDFNFEDWYQEKTKCVLPDGTISENCSDVEGSGTESPPITSDPWENMPEAQYEVLDYNNYEENDNFDYDENLRKRNRFKRSKYSRRYKE